MRPYSTGRKPWRSEPFQEETDDLQAARGKLFYFGLLVFVVFAVLTLQLARMQLVNGEAYRLREKRAALPGARVVVEPRREYTQGSLMAHVLGFVGAIDQEEYDRLAASGYRLDDRLGKGGVELSYEGLLRGAPRRPG